MKSKIFIFTTLILVVFLFVITSCNYFLNGNNNTTININLDLSKIVKTSRNVVASNSTEYILKVFAYNAASYKPEDEIENLPLLTQTVNKVDINGKVKARLDVTIGLNVIFVAKLYQGEAEEPLYAGKSEVIKIKTTNNKVHLVLTRENADIANIPEGFVLVKGATITGAEYTDSEYTELYYAGVLGVFIEGRTVTLSDFYMGKYEVTQEEYASVMAGQKVTVDGKEYVLESNPSFCTADSTIYTLFSGDVQGKRPVEGVSWYDAVWYCNVLSQKEGLNPAYDIEVTRVERSPGKTDYYIYDANVTLNKDANGYRLPTEAEREYAARGGDQTAPDWNFTFSGADKAVGTNYEDKMNSGLDNVGWYNYNTVNGTTGDKGPSSGGQGYGTHQVGKKAANRLGLYDMNGNVGEWCYDWYGTVSTGIEFDPYGASSGESRIFRGGSWESTADCMSVSYRSASLPLSRARNLGFRVVRTATEVIDHTHTFATEWTKDETHHWHAATCEHTTEVSEKEEHTYINGICVCGMREMVLIRAGTFKMGSTEGNPNTTPVHEVTITKPFYMGKYEVTQAEYEKYCSYTGTNSPSSSRGDGDNYPAYYVSWYDALVYCNKRSMAEGLTPCYSIKGSTDPKVWGTVPSAQDATWDSVICDWNANGYRLPTEAEREYAARAGDNTVDSLTYSGTSDVNKLGDYAWYYDSANDNTHEVGTKLSNAFGLYDMSGNVWEWCWNIYTDSYNTTTEGGNDPTGVSVGSNRVIRGGGWNKESGYCSVSCRGYTDGPYFCGNILGFRVVRTALTE